MGLHAFTFFSSRAALLALPALMVFSSVSAAAGGSLAVSKIVPSVATANEEVVVYGAGFGKGVRVHLGERALSVRVESPTRLRVSVPEGARSGELVVQRGGQVARSPVLEIVRFHAPPEISGISPKVVKPGGLLRVKGTGFGEANRTLYVSVGGAIAAVVERAPDALLVRVPEDATSGAVIVVVSRGGQAIASTHVVVDDTKAARRAPAGAAKPSAAR